MKNRILSIIEDHKMTPGQFADEIGVQRSAISHIMSERNKPSMDMISKILNRFPDVDANWLISGKYADSNQIRKSQEVNLFDFNESNSDNSNTYTNNYTSNFDPNLNQNRENPLNSAPFSHQPSIFPNNANTAATQSVPQNFQARQPNIPNLNPTPSMTQVKKVKRIIVFYDDDTFEELIRS